MVSVVLDKIHRQMDLHATVVTYGNASSSAITRQIAEEIEVMWNEARGMVELKGVPFAVNFRIRPLWMPDLNAEVIFENTDPAINYYRIEEFVFGNISFVDGLGSNSGYFKLENLYTGSTTAAHEFGHGLGLDHPIDLDIRGKGRPGIMYPRGTWVDPAYQYDSTARPGDPGGTMHPMHRRVLSGDIKLLGLHRLDFVNGRTVLGGFSNVFHTDHAQMNIG
jgi:hypothetical protein